jgi:hypothetical protein
MSDECLELKNINYQTMLLKNNKTNINSNHTSTNIENIDIFLSKEKLNDKKKSWSKLDKASKLKKLLSFSTQYCELNNLNKQDDIKLKEYLFESLDRKKLQKLKDVDYDISNGVIKCIPNLIFEKEKKKFTLKRDKKNSSLRLPRKTQKKKKEKLKKLKKKPGKMLKTVKPLTGPASVKPLKKVSKKTVKPLEKVIKELKKLKKLKKLVKEPKKLVKEPKKLVKEPKKLVKKPKKLVKKPKKPVKNKINKIDLN